MKKCIFLLCIAIWSAVSASAQSRIDSDGNEVHHWFLGVAEYQISDFDFVKESGCYGLGMAVTSFSHWGAFHVGANANFSINDGLVDPSSCIVDFGPSARVDINKNFFVNIPVNAVCVVTSIEGTTDSETNWGAKIAPSIHAFFSDRVGIYAGPKVTFASGSTSFGMQAGLSYSF